MPRKQYNSTVLTGEPDRVMGAGGAVVVLEDHKQRQRF